ncbi:GAF sensor signal transduction histidine kinase [Anaeromyxobacter dehalogenans 2CP-1]|uniref:histidine kinase n=1 Tax=Anaeromyxobacter dehalogenans (strain ATCC BAA-258 / DSM 21875 / 2CP-1) TaxID=455488 RepID=B8J8D7_ANAD2|nr:ATP-binding protein [Anaeromyxobacter dehalogenans]ACL65436.1 GAF sensor signal transduction histidine kinase [Anaeromyxobacter dehalogenans 2CP-1]
MELLRARTELTAAWQAFLVDGRLPPRIRPEIRRSWLRVREEARVDPRLRASPLAVGPEDVVARGEGDDAARIAAGVVAHYAERLRDGGHVVAYFDADGVMLACDGDPRTRRALDRVNFAPGACWAEGVTGTNAPGTALVEGRPLEVFAAEHFVEVLQPWTCASAPVRLGGRVVGAVDITSPWTAHHASLLPTAEAVAQVIEGRLEAEAARAHADLMMHVAGSALHARDDFLTVASHELKTPLTPLRAKLQAVQRLLDRTEGELDPARLRASLRGADAQVGRVVAVVERLLDGARLLRDPIRPAPEPVDLGELVRGAVERRRDDLQRQGCHPTVTVVGEVTGCWDPALLDQALERLLSNAARYAPGPVEIEVAWDGPSARVLVRDHGPGILPDDRERIFLPYERAVSCRNSAGLGLGLHAVRAIAAAHGGTVHVERAPGHGSTFVLALPRVASPR